MIRELASLLEGAKAVVPIDAFCILHYALSPARKAVLWGYRAGVYR